MNAFYASVEQRDHQLLQGKPIAVGSKLRSTKVRGAFGYAITDCKAAVPRTYLRSSKDGCVQSSLCPSP